MNNKLFGDERDFYKYALLRVLSDGGKKSIGVCWLLLENGSVGGGELDYLHRDSCEQEDPELLHFLRKHICEKKTRNVSVMDDKIIPGAKYFSRLFPATGGRDDYFQQAAKELGGCNLIFFDPDVGVMPDDGPSPKNGEGEYIRKEEIQRMWDTCEESSLAVFQYFRMPYYSDDTDAYGKMHRRIVKQLQSACKGAEILCFHRSPISIYFMLRQKPNIVYCKMDELGRRLGFLTPIC